ncbi:MAG: fibronectin type III domain-containing protein [Streptosporangiaceae bacterium]
MTEAAAARPGWMVQVPAPQPLDAARRYQRSAAVSFTDGLNSQTTYLYHVQLTGLEPGTRYYYQVTDGGTRRPRPAPRSRPRPAAGPRSASPATVTWPPRPGTRTPRETSGTSPATTPGTR